VTTKIVVPAAVLERVLRKPVRYLSKDVSLVATLVEGTPEGAEVLVESTPPPGHLLAIRYFRLRTPPEVAANILVTGADWHETKLLAEDQGEDLDVVYDASDWDADFVVATRVRLYARALVRTTSDRTASLSFCGGLIRI